MAFERLSDDHDHVKVDHGGAVHCQQEEEDDPSYWADTPAQAGDDQLAMLAS